jgi:ABC-type transporter MlaC component
MKLGRKYIKRGRRELIKINIIRQRKKVKIEYEKRKNNKTGKDKEEEGKVLKEN